MHDKVRNITTKSLVGRDVLAYLPAIAQLRMEVFREWPYYYDGDYAYEEKYLASYAQSARSLFVLIHVDGDLAGAATGVPLADESADVQQPFVDGSMPLDAIFYFGESVLRAKYRGLGIGHRFFDAREAYARSLAGIDITCFCARAEPPARRADDTGLGRSLHAFWRARGYVPEAGLQTEFSWKQIGEAAESPKRMQFWLKRW
jgi:GNAT superfamily N-acetyltransferase